MAKTKEKVFDENGEEVRISPRTGKPMKKPRGGNNFLQGENSLNVEPGDNARFLKASLHWAKAPAVSLRDPEEVQNRVDEYFEHMIAQDMKPTVSGLAMALGMDRRRLWAIKAGAPNGGNQYNKPADEDLPRASTDLIKKAYFIMENMWENYMNNGKINPMAGVFLGINNFGYQDTKKIDVTPVAQEDKQELSKQELLERYNVIDSEPTE